MGDSQDKTFKKRYQLINTVYIGKMDTNTQNVYLFIHVSINIIHAHTGSLEIRDKNARISNKCVKRKLYFEIMLGVMICE